MWNFETNLMVRKFKRITKDLTFTTKVIVISDKFLCLFIIHFKMGLGDLEARAKWSLECLTKTCSSACSKTTSLWYSTLDLFTFTISFSCLFTKKHKKNIRLGKVVYFKFHTWNMLIEILICVDNEPPIHLQGKSRIN